ncbi:hypothetical protein FPQ18DRAFT_304169 [Pyronema domesticum]|nr:hypothetical protein FPQ18DRAFT_304169 [Pyronema domesticum]
MATPRSQITPTPPTSTDRNMATPRSQITPTPPPAAFAAFEFRPPSSHTTSSTTMDPAKDVASDNGQSENGGDGSDKDRSSLEPAEKSGGSVKNSGRAKKKKGTKFHCTNYGPCNLSFTRSEHLARHIRKHTGERPFMCHCGRWFSRLDNLRQHSSTVHADEEIPEDSLAATGTRYQRQGRPERAPRSRAQSQGDIQPPNIVQEMDMEPEQPSLGSPMPDRQRTRRRPSPIHVAPPDNQQDRTFSQYRDPDHTPPDSPASTASLNFSGYPYRTTTSYRTAADSGSPIDTPTSSRMGSTLDSPFGSPAHLTRNAHMFDRGGSVAGRRLSMPVPPSSSLLNPTETRAHVHQAIPQTGYPVPSTPRRDSLTSVIMADDRRRTWHLGAGVNPLANYATNLQPNRDIITPTTQSFARTQLNSPTTVEYPIAPTRAPPTDRLPSIHFVLNNELNPQSPAPRPEHQQQPSSPWAGADILERPPTSDLKRPFNEFREGISAVSGRRIAPGQVRSSHGRSISNIETRRWGGGHNIPAYNNPFSGPVDNRDRRIDLSYMMQPGNSAENQRPGHNHQGGHGHHGHSRNSSYMGYSVLPSIPSPREHRQSFGSSDSNVSEGIHTPVAPQLADTRNPVIFGEPGDAVYTDVPEREYSHHGNEMSGIEMSCQPSRPQTADQEYSDASRLDALVSAAAKAAKM